MKLLFAAALVATLIVPIASHADEFEERFEIAVETPPTAQIVGERLFAGPLIAFGWGRTSPCIAATVVGIPNGGNQSVIIFDISVGTSWRFFDNSEIKAVPVGTMIDSSGNERCLLDIGGALGVPREGGISIILQSKVAFGVHRNVVLNMDEVSLYSWHEQSFERRRWADRRFIAGEDQHGTVTIYGDDLGMLARREGCKPALFVNDETADFLSFSCSFRARLVARDGSGSTRGSWQNEKEDLLPNRCTVDFFHPLIKNDHKRFASEAGAASAYLFVGSFDLTLYSIGRCDYSTLARGVVSSVVRSEGSLYFLTRQGSSQSSTNLMRLRIGSQSPEAVATLAVPPPSWYPQWRFLTANFSSDGMLSDFLIAGPVRENDTHKMRIFAVSDQFGVTDVTAQHFPGVN